MSQELSVRAHAASPVDLSMLLTFTAMIWFYASLVIYIVVAVTRNRSSTSVLRAYGATAVLTMLFAFLYQPPRSPLANLEAVALAGNFLFPMMLVGWRLGDRLRLTQM